MKWFDLIAAALLRRMTAGKATPASLGLQPAWLGQHTNPAKRQRRQAIATVGRRQYLRTTKATRRAVKGLS